MPTHLLKIIRGFAVEGPSNLVLGLLRAWQPEAIKVTLVSLSEGGLQRAEFEKEIARLGGNTVVLPTSWRTVKATAKKIREQPWFPSVTHVGAHLLRPDAVARAVVAMTKLPYLLTEHGLHGLSEGPILTRPFAQRWYRGTFPEGAVAAGVSPKVCRGLRRLLRPTARVELLQNGIDLSRFAPAGHDDRMTARKNLGVPEDAQPVLATVGSLSARKDSALSVEILQEFVRMRDRRPHLILCGEGSLREEIESRLHHAGLMKHATLTGHIADPRPVYTAADILVHPCRDEPFGLVVAEAAASGLPILTRAGSGADEIAPPWPLASSVEGRDVETWTASALSLLPHSPQRSAALRSYAVAHFQIEQTALRYLSLLASQCPGNYSLSPIL
ncbi:glycosyltransferase [Candidatus Sumerlaeota bacterium]|nr:glycosyltransferase [Candidatus Sumerlaeota bacterium]